MIRTFNRTSLELKPVLMSQSSRFVSLSFNRTSLELKLVISPAIHSCINLLIEPVWNWNTEICQRHGSLLPPFNRTSLELKPSHQDLLAVLAYVLLIEPVWNWNTVMCLCLCRILHRTNLGWKQKTARQYQIPFIQKIPEPFNSQEKPPDPESVSDNEYLKIRVICVIRVIRDSDNSTQFNNWMPLQKTR